jgi:hypothetical protein
MTVEQTVPAPAETPTVSVDREVDQFLFDVFYEPVLMGKTHTIGDAICRSGALERNY